MYLKSNKKICYIIGSIASSSLLASVGFLAGSSIVRGLYSNNVQSLDNKLDTAKVDIDDNTNEISSDSSISSDIKPRAIDDALSTSFKVDSSNSMFYYTYDQTKAVRGINRFFMMSQYAYVNEIFEISLKNGYYAPNFFLNAVIDTQHESTPWNFWGVEYLGMGRKGGNFAENFHFGKNTGGNLKNVVVGSSGRLYWDGSQINKYAGKRLEGLIWFSQMTWWTLTGYTPPDNLLKMDRGRVQLIKDSYGKYPASYDYADDPKSNWNSALAQFGIFDDVVYHGTTDPSTITITSKINKIDMNVDEFIYSVNEKNIGNYIRAELHNTPSYAIDGDSNEKTDVSIVDNEQKSRVEITMNSPYIFQADFTRINEVKNNSNHEDALIANKKWFTKQWSGSKQTGMTATYYLPYSMFNERPAIQEVTKPKENIPIDDLSILSTTLNSTMYNIDFINRANINNDLVEYINKNPDIFFDNPPSEKEANDNPIVMKNTSLIIRTESKQTSSVLVQGFFLTRRKYSSQKPEYVLSSFRINGFNTKLTEITTETISCVDSPELAKFTAEEILFDEPELIRYIKRTDTIKRIFSNYPEVFITNTLDKIKINAIVSRSLFTGEIVINVTAPSYARVDEKESTSGYGSITGDVKISGFNIPPDAEVRQDLIIDELEIEGINSSTYSIDVSMNSFIRDMLITDLNKNPTKYINNMWAISQWESQFSDLEITHNKGDVYVSGQVVKRVDNKKIIRAPFSTTIHGFNVNNTVVYEDYDGAVSTSEGLYFEGFNYVAASVALSNPDYKSRIFTSLRENVGHIFENYSNCFLEYNSKYMGIKIKSIDNIKGQAIFELSTKYAYVDGEFTDMNWLVKISGFRQYDSLPSYNIDVKLDNALIDLNNESILASSLSINDIHSYIFEKRNNIFNFTGTFLDIDSELWWEENLIIDNIYPDDKTGVIKVDFTLKKTNNQNKIIKNTLTFFGLKILSYVITFKSSLHLLNVKNVNLAPSNLSEIHVKEIIINERSNIFNIPTDFVQLDNLAWWEENLSIKFKSVSNLWGVVDLSVTLRNSNSFGLSINSDVSINGLNSKISFNDIYYSFESNTNKIDGARAGRQGMLGINWNDKNIQNREKMVMELMVDNWKKYIFNDYNYFDITNIYFSNITYNDNDRSITFNGLRVEAKSINTLVSYKEIFMLPTFTITNVPMSTSNNPADSIVVTKGDFEDKSWIWIFVGTTLFTIIILVVIIWLAIKAKRETTNIFDDYLDI